jgi:hypothetical protein
VQREQLGDRSVNCFLGRAFAARNNWIRRTDFKPCKPRPEELTTKTA